MPLTPLHFIPALVIYLLLFPYVDFLALFVAVVILDIEPSLNLFVFRAFPLHGVFHSLFGSLMIVAPILVAVLRFLERRSIILVKIFGIIGWHPRIRSVSVRMTVASVYVGVASHLVLDFWMHDDIPVFYPFSEGNPFQSWPLMILSHTVLFLSLVITPLLYFIGKKIHGEKPFSHLP